jgi:D-alanyl-lipoteichoic acid acyltransferase DltB (MBOAT superfamily)
MQFNSAEFLIFFPTVLLIYFALPHRWRWVLLLGASYTFYMAWQAEYALLLLFSTVLDYSLALWIEATEQIYGRKLLLAVSLSANLGLLFVFKYLNFFSGATQQLFELFNIPYQIPAYHLLLPVGISFYTFQTMSYTIDVYRRVQKAERHLGIFGLYVSFFPQLVAGPIERSTNLLPQFMARHAFDYARVTSGLRRMAWGFFKKVVIADKAAVIVDAIYNSPTEQSGLTLLLATYLFAFQIYCDFSGYSDIAIGAARVLGFDLMENFRQPYLAQSLADFWRRWHISLSTWFRDYLYIPLGGSRVSLQRHCVNVVIVFVVSGLWHGANWTFIIWGALHGSYLVLELLLQKPLRWFVSRLQLDRTPWLLTAMRTAIVFHLVLFAWIFFRARSVDDALYIIGQIADLFWGQWTAALLQQRLPMGNLTALVLAFSIGLMALIEYLRRTEQLQLPRRPLWLRWTAYYALVVLIVLFGELTARGQFIYFQF